MIVTIRYLFGIVYHNPCFGTRILLAGMQLTYINISPFFQKLTGFRKDRPQVADVLEHQAECKQIILVLQKFPGLGNVCVYEMNLG